MTTVIIIFLLVCLVGWAIFHTVQKSKKGGGCCGDHEEPAKRVPVSDRNKNHYPYKRTLTIGGMTCENCAVRVENALNSLPGTWAKVDIADKKAAVLFIEEPDENLLRKTIADAGYVLMGIS